jgi:orotidine-5'-phosphate decarboxylase
MSDAFLMRPRTMPHPPSIIPSLDTDLETACQIVEQLRGVSSVSWFKVGSILVLEHGLGYVCNKVRMVDDQARIILDLQKGATDIPYIVEKQVEKAAECGIDAFIGAPLGSGSETKSGGTLETFVKACTKWNIAPVVLMEMTHPGANYFLRKSAHEKLVERVCELEVPYAVVPANKPARVAFYRKLFGESKIELIGTGVGAQGSGTSLDTTGRDAATAVANGADHIIVGRALYGSTDRVFASTSIHRSVTKAFELRGTARHSS